jgi:hypothetical protein
LQLRSYKFTNKWLVRPYNRALGPRTVNWANWAFPPISPRVGPPDTTRSVYMVDFWIYGHTIADETAKEAKGEEEIHQNRAPTLHPQVPW